MRDSQISPEYKRVWKDGTGNGRKNDLPILMPVHDTWRYLVCVCTCADNEEDNEKESLEVKESRLDGILVRPLCNEPTHSKHIEVLESSLDIRYLLYLAFTYHFRGGMPLPAGNEVPVVRVGS